MLVFNYEGHDFRIKSHIIKKKTDNDYNIYICDFIIDYETRDKLVNLILEDII